MKVHIQAESQEEFDSKRPELIKALAGKAFKVDIDEAKSSRPSEPRPCRFTAQAEILRHYDNEFSRMIEDLKREIGDIIDEA